MFLISAYLLQIIFILFKILGISLVSIWSWWLVLLPLWIIIGVYAITADYRTYITWKNKK